VSLIEIEEAVKGLSREELAKLAAYIAKQDKLYWDEQLEEDFSPGGKHASARRRSMPRLMLETSGPCREVPCARFVLAVLRCSA
jgi:hypothetical protein